MYLSEFTMKYTPEIIKMELTFLKVNHECNNKSEEKEQLKSFAKEDDLETHLLEIRDLQALAKRTN